MKQEETLISYGTDIHSNIVHLLTRETLTGLMRSPEIRAIHEQIAQHPDRLQALKRKLPYACWQASFPDGKRTNSGAVRSGLVALDSDNLKGAREWYLAHVSGHEGEWGIVGAYVTPSNEGLKILARLAWDVEIADAQRGLATLLDIPYDACTRDLARASFMVAEDHWLYLDEEELFTPTPAGYRMPFDCPGSTAASTPTEAVVEQSALSGKFHRASQPMELLRLFWKAEMEEAGISPALLEVVGQRHTLLLQLLPNLSVEMSKDDIHRIVESEMPAYYHADPDCRQLIEDYYPRYYDATKPIPSRLASRVMEVLRSYYGDSGEDETADTGQADAVPMTLEDSRLRLFPKPLRILLSSVPEDIRLPALVGSVISMGVLTTGARLRYLDGKEQRTTLLGVLVGPAASGKSQVMNIVNLLIAKLREADKPVWDEFQKFLSDATVTKRKKDGESSKRPRLNIRIIPSSVSSAAIMAVMHDTEGEIIFIAENELSELIRSNKKGAWANITGILRKSFDGDEAGQLYLSSESFSGNNKANIALFCNATYSVFDELLSERNVENGMASRLLIAEMPDNDFDSIRCYHTFSDDERREIDEAVERLMSFEGEISLPKLNNHVNKWLEAKAREALDEGRNRIKARLRKRAAVIAFRAACIYWILQGNDTVGKRLLDFFDLMADYTLAMQTRYLGPKIESSIELQHSRTFAHHDIYAMLPRQFSSDDMYRLLAFRNIRGGSARKVIMDWRRKNLIKDLSKGLYRKLA